MVMGNQYNFSTPPGEKVWQHILQGRPRWMQISHSIFTMSKGLDCIHPKQFTRQQLNGEELESTTALLRFATHIMLAEL